MFTICGVIFFNFLAKSTFTYCSLYKGKISRDRCPLVVDLGRPNRSRTGLNFLDPSSNARIKIVFFLDVKSIALSALANKLFNNLFGRHGPVIDNILCL